MWACVASVKILWLMQLRVCLVISTSPAQPSRHFRWSSFDWAQIRKIKQFSIVPRVSPVPPPQPHPITGRLETWLQFYFQTETMKNNLVEENIFLQLLWSVRLNVEWDCLWCPGSLVQSGGSRQRGDHYEATSMDNFSSSGELDGYFNLDRQTRISFSLSRHTTGVYVHFF